MSIIDELWRRPPERGHLARGLLQNLTAWDWLLLAAWDTAATFGPSSGWVVFRQPTTFAIFDSSAELRLIAALVECDSTHDAQVIFEYRTTDRCVALDAASPDQPTIRETHDPAGLLLALQLIRDHLDTTLLKPPELRARDLARFARAANIGDDTFRRLSSWYPTVARHVEAE
jgi:hypothetical protein